MNAKIAKGELSEEIVDSLCESFTTGIGRTLLLRTG